MALHRMVWDLIGTEWGMRGDIYERFTLGHYQMGRRRLAETSDLSVQRLLAERYLTHVPSDTNPFPIEEHQFPMQPPVALQYPVSTLHIDHVDDFTERFTKRGPAHLDRVQERTLEQFGQVAHMLSGNQVGRFLSSMSWLISPRVVVDCGTFTGFSSLALAEGLGEGGTVVTFETDSAAADLAERNFADSPYRDRIRLVRKSAVDGIDDVEGPIDLAFIDAEKDVYVAIYDKIVERLAPRGLIILDNMLFSGTVFAPERDMNELPPRVRELREGVLHANRRIQDDDRVDNVLIPLRDGLMLVRRR